MNDDVRTTLALRPPESQHRASQYGAIGQPIRRREDRRLLTGSGRFTDDFNKPGQVYAVMVRSPHPHARIRGVDTARARALPGVLAVLTAADCMADGLGTIAHNPVPSTRTDLKLTGPGGGPIFIGPQPLLPADKVRHAGEAVAMVVAESLAQALDAAEAVAVDYDPLPAAFATEAALAADAPAVWDEVPDNVLVDTRFGDGQATERAFAAAVHIVAMEFHIGRVTGVPLEPRAALAEYDAESGRYTLIAGSGGAVRQKIELAALFGVAPERVRVLSYDVGGNFGTRNRVYVEFGLVLWAARKLGRPVKYTATRSEAFLSDFQGRDLVTKVALAFAEDGRLTAPHKNRSFDLFELAREAALAIAKGRPDLPSDLADGLTVVAQHEMHDPVFPNGCAVCEIEIDPETGALDLTRYAVVDDVGRCINPLIVHGQTHGGIAQAVGEALWEECAIDPASGQPLCGSFMDYGMPRADTLPSFKTEIVEILSPTNPFGIKAGGEGGCTPALAVVVSAILDALAPLGVRDITMPATPLRVWQAIRAAQAGAG